MAPRLLKGSQAFAPLLLTQVSLLQMQTEKEEVAMSQMKKYWCLAATSTQRNSKSPKAKTKLQKCCSHFWLFDASLVSQVSVRLAGHQNALSPPGCHLL